MDTDYLRITLAECLRAVRFTARPTDQLVDNVCNAACVPAIEDGRWNPSLPALTVPKEYLSSSLAHLTRATPQTPDPMAEDPGVGAWLCYFLGVSFDQSNQPAQALHCYQRALIATAHDAIHDPELKMLIFQGFGNAYLARGASRQAIAFFALAQKHGLDVCNPRAQGLTEWGLGLAYREQGDLPQAKRMLSQALQRFEQLNMLPLVAQVRSSLGLVLMQLQHDDEAEHLLRQGLGLALRCGDPYTRGVALGNLAALHVARGKSEKAIRTVEEGLETLQKTRNHQLAGYLYLTLARAYEALHHPTAAETAITMAIRQLHQTRQHGLIVRAYERYGQFLADQGRFQEAYEQLQLPTFAPTDFPSGTSEKKRDG